MSATRSYARAPVALTARGFSLLELLVALFVVIMVTSLVSLNVSPGGSDLRLETQLRNLVGVAGYALDEAEFLGRDFGLLLRELDEDGERVYSYEWRERRPVGWREPESGKDVFRREKLSPDVELELALDDAAIAENSPREDEEGTTPQVIFYASGETTSGAIDVRRRNSGDLLWRLEWDLLGRFELLRRGEEEPEF